MVNERIEIVLNVTNGCNLDCHYCCYANEMEQRPSNMSLQTVERIIQNVARSSAKSINFSIHGGELLLRKTSYLKDIFTLQQKYLDEKEVRNSIQTNGTLFNKEFINTYKEIEQLGVHIGLGVSLDGPKQIHSCIKNISKKHQWIV